MIATFLAVAAAPIEALAGQYVVYLHGRSMNMWPGNAYLASSSSWMHVNPSYNGSARLTNASARDAVRNALGSYCRAGNTCVVACYSAGCARALLAIEDLRAAGTPADGIQWIEAAASAAGGTEVASYSTNKGLRILAKLFLTNPGPGAEAIDYDITPGNMRGSYGYIQNSSPAPMYHLAGSGNICIKTKVSGLVTGAVSKVGRWIGGPVGFFISAASKLLGSVKFKLCGNSVMPGNKGDGAVPVHSAAGYADTGAHYDHNDGGAKYTFRAYEQVPLFAQDHRGIFEPFVSYGSLRLAVGKNASCANHPLGTATESDASIVYEDADSAVVEEATPLYMLMVCGNDVWNGDSKQYGTCLGEAGCCDNFSTENSGGCSCGESLCIQGKWEFRSFYTGPDCDGQEYSENDYYASWDGNGMVGTSPVSVTVQSGRTADGLCRRTVHKRTWGGQCAEYNDRAVTITARRVWRKDIDGWLADPNGTLSWSDGIVMSSFDYDGHCP